MNTTTNVHWVEKIEKEVTVWRPKSPTSKAEPYVTVRYTFRDRDGNEHTITAFSHKGEEGVKDLETVDVEYKTTEF